MRDPVRVRTLAAELISLAPDLIVAHTTPVTTALKAATHSIPVIFAVVNDPVGQGLIAIRQSSHAAWLRKIG
jgi:putative ABC transport system substrate-binding protein